MTGPRLLIADGNTKDRNDAMQAVGGELGAERYANEIRRLFPDIRMDLVYPADADGYLPAGAGLADYDGMVMGGSGLRAFDDTPEVRRQVDLMRAALEAGLPVLGSCWGLQIAAVAAGGAVEASPRGREVGIARKIELTPEGRDHPLYAGKASVFDSPCIHYDEVTRLPSGSQVLAANAHSAVQAAEIVLGAGRFWGVQYHPEFDLPHLAKLYRRYGEAMIADGFFADAAALARHADALETLHRTPARRDLRWQLAIDDDVLIADVRCLEIRNWVASLIDG